MLQELTPEQRAIVDEVDKGISDQTVCEYIEETSDVELSDFQEAYSGTFNSDQDFAKDMAEQTGAVDFKNQSWPAYCIDWDYAARELMMDYTKIDGCYFRNI